mgnify:CR=1 FL=1
MWRSSTSPSATSCCSHVAQPDDDERTQLTRSQPRSPLGSAREHLARLRFFITTRHTDGQLRYAADKLAEINATFNRTPVRGPPQDRPHATD